MTSQSDGTTCSQQKTAAGGLAPVHWAGNRLNDIILNFTPSWFSVNMGTGIIGILLYTAPYKLPGQSVIAFVIYMLNIFLFLLFSVITATRYYMFPWVAPLMLKNPAQALFLGTIPMGLATIVNATALQAVPHIGVGLKYFTWGLWWFDVVLSLASAVGVPFLLFHYHKPTLDKMTAAWLLPVVPLVVAAASGGVVATVLEPDHALITIFVSYVIWGAGMGLAFMLMALYLLRLAMHDLPNPEVVVSAYLPLGPLGQGAFGLMQLSVAGKSTFSEVNLLSAPEAGTVIYVMSHIGGLMLWGFGLWWLIHGTYCVIVRAFKTKLKFNMGFWGFIFPLGVFTAATISLGKDLASAFFRYLSMVFIIILLCLYIFVAGKTAIGTYKGTLFVAPCLSARLSQQANTPEYIVSCGEDKEAELEDISLLDERATS